MAPYQDYKLYMSRFVSEFGFESAPNIRTIHAAITDPKERFSQSSTWDVHDKAPGNTRRYGMYMSENFRFIVHPLDNYVYCTQFLQAEAMKYAYNLWRREFKGPGKEYCSGALVWQLNDIWPGMSWAVVDVDLNPKSAFYVIKRALAPVVVGMERTVTKDAPFPAVINYLPEKGALDVWAVNGRVQDIEAVVRLSAFDIESGKPVQLAETEMTTTLLSNRASEVGKLVIPNAKGTVVVARLSEKGSETILARWVSWPEPLKFLYFAKDLKVTAKVVGEDKVVLSANAPAKGVVLSIAVEEGDDAQWDDNFLDLVPGENLTIGVKGLKGRSVKLRWLCDWE
jgi:beta-mannosidase